MPYWRIRKKWNYHYSFLWPWPNSGPPTASWGPAKAEPLSQGWQLQMEQCKEHPHIIFLCLWDGCCACGCPNRQAITTTNTSMSLDIEALAPLHCGFKHLCHGSCSKAFRFQHYCSRFLIWKDLFLTWQIPKAMGRVQSVLLAMIRLFRRHTQTLRLQSSPKQRVTQTSRQL